MRENKQTRRIRFFSQLERLGVSFEDADALRRIQMTLHRWAELKCGDGNYYGSWAIERDEETEKPYMVQHHYMHGRGKDYTTRTPIADREKGALKRLDKIMKNYPALVYYHQTDPRGCALYIIPKDKLEAGDRLDSVYTRGIAVCVD